MTRHVSDLTETGISWCNRRINPHEVHIKDLNHLFIYRRYRPDNVICKECIKTIEQSFKEVINAI